MSWDLLVFSGYIISPSNPTIGSIISPGTCVSKGSSWCVLSSLSNISGSSISPSASLWISGSKISPLRLREHSCSAYIFP